MTNALLTINLPDDGATQRLGAKLAPLLRAGDVVLLSGDLGAGKTTLSRGLIGALCGADDVPSPTYTLVQTYDAPEYEIWHFDLYRLKTPSEVWELGIEDAFYEGVSLIEWPQRLGYLKPDTALEIDIRFKGEGRTAVLTGPPRWAERFQAASILEGLDE